MPAKTNFIPYDNEEVYQPLMSLSFGSLTKKLTLRKCNSSVLSS